MCGRFAQYRTAIEYLAALRANVSDVRTGLETHLIIPNESVCFGSRLALSRPAAIGHRRYYDMRIEKARRKAWLLEVVRVRGFEPLRLCW